ncbi:hypothetical protein D3C72_1636460 [compost metagenome]
MDNREGLSRNTKPIGAMPSPFKDSKIKSSTTPTIVQVSPFVIFEPIGFFMPSSAIICLLTMMPILSEAISGLKLRPSINLIP